MKSITKVAIASLLAIGTSAVAAPAERSNPLTRGPSERALERMNERALEVRPGSSGISRATPATRATPAVPATRAVPGSSTGPATPAVRATPAVPAIPAVPPAPAVPSTQGPPKK
jgi:hypothetical protein